MPSTIKPVFWGHLVAVLSGAKLLDMKVAHRAIEAVGGVQVNPDSPAAIHTLLAGLEGTESYSYISYILAMLTGIEEEALCRAANIVQGHLDSPEGVPDHMMRKMNAAVYREFDHRSSVGVIAQSVADVLDELVRMGRLEASHITPLLGFYIPPFLYRAHKTLEDVEGSTYRALYFSLDHLDREDRIKEILFHVSYMVDVPVSDLESCLDKVLVAREVNKSFSSSDLQRLLGVAAA